MKRALVGGIALVTLLGFTAGATAQEPAPPPSPIRDVGRFQQLAVDANAKVTGKFATSSPDKVVSATVTLQGDSVTAAQARAERLNQRFDKAAAERQVLASQAAVLPNLRAAGATVRSTTKTVLNAVTVRVKVKDLQGLAAVAGVANVHVSYKVHPFNGVSDEYTGVPTVWGDLDYTGLGMTIGVIDDGLDYYHADFGGAGDPNDWLNDDGTAIEAGTFPTTKVTGGYDFVGDDYDANLDPPFNIPAPDPDPLACGHHGTHVSGTAAGQGVLDDGSTFTGPYDADTLNDNEFLVAPGAAPEASIRIYKVFGCEGSVNDDVLLDAIEMAVNDGVDVINMSLGSSWGTAEEPLAIAIDNATSAGVLSVVSAGNSGPGAYLVGGPSTANTALSVAAVDTSSATLPGVAITGDVTLSAQNSNDHVFVAPISGELVNVGLGCAAGDYTGTAGKIAVTQRGVCPRIDRAILGDAAGALAVIFINDAAGYPPVEGVIAGVDIPFVGVTADDGDLFDNGLDITINGGATIPNPSYTNYASFTSNGPRSDSAPKPDISAPGVNILSASAGTGTLAEPNSGTSMSAPHTAGIAILVRQAHPSWGPTAVKGALMATADPSGVGDFDVVRGGAGMVSAPDAADTVAYVSTTDGRNNLAFGFRQLTGNFVAARSFKITNSSASPITYDISANVDDLGVDLTVGFSPSTVTVPGHSSRSVSVSLHISDPENLPDVSADDGGSLATIDGLVVADPRSSAAGVHNLNVPLVLVPYGVSDIRSVGTGSAPANAPVKIVSSIKLTNTGVHYGTYDTYQWAITDATGENFDDLVPDIRDVGVQQFDIGGEDLMVFAVSTRDRITTLATGEYDIWIDVGDDGSDDFVLVGIDEGLFLGGSPNGVVAAFLLDVNNGFSIVSGFTAVAPANGAVAELPLLVNDLGATGPISFSVNSFSVVADLPPDVTARGSYDPTNPAVSNGAFDFLDAGDNTLLPVTVDVPAAIEQGALGWLVVSVDDAAGPREADRVPLRARKATRSTV